MTENEIRAHAVRETAATIEDDMALCHRHWLASGECLTDADHRTPTYADSGLVRETAAKIAEENSDLMDRLAAVTSADRTNGSSR